MKLEDKIALATGSTGGIGAVTAWALAREGERGQSNATRAALAQATGIFRQASLAC